MVQMWIVVCGEELFMGKPFIVVIILVSLGAVKGGVGFSDPIVIFFLVVCVLSMPWIWKCLMCCRSAGGGRRVWWFRGFGGGG